MSDVIVGASSARPYSRSDAGSSYVVYGKKGGYPTLTIDLNLLTINQGITGAKAGDRTGFSVGLAGDFNGDGLSDVIVGAPWASPKDRKNGGASYIIYGERSPLDMGPDEWAKK